MSALPFKLPAQRVALVTGAARGMGKSIALRLCRDGYDVAVADVRGSRVYDTAREVEALGRRSVAMYTDVTKEDEVAKLVGDVGERMGYVDIMVANAGIGSANTVLDASLKDYQETMSVNAQGVFLCYKHAALKMIEQGRGGRIIGACSMAGKVGDRNVFVYSASKFAVRGMTQAAALELAKHNITVNAYAPSVVDTDMTRKVFEQVGKAMPEEEATPMGRIGKPDDVAGLVSYLASEDAGFVTGQSIGINGGLHFD